MILDFETVVRDFIEEGNRICSRLICIFIIGMDEEINFSISKKSMIFGSKAINSCFLLI